MRKNIHAKKDAALPCVIVCVSLRLLDLKRTEIKKKLDLDIVNSFWCFLMDLICVPGWFSVTPEWRC